MHTSPVLSSIIAPQYINQLIQTQYQTSSYSICTVFRTGINHTYLIKEGESKYIFRVYSYNWRSKEEIQEELSYLSLLKDDGVSVSYPIADKDGLYIQQINAPEGLRYAVLFSYAEGEKIRTLTEQHCYQMGLLLAQCHKVSQNITLKRVEYNIETLVQKPYQYALQYYASSLEEMEFVNKAKAYFKTLLRTENTNTLSRGIVHLDFWYDNMNITEESNITVFDFDFCGNGWLILDIAYCLMQLFHAEPEKTKYEQKLNSFYKGYESLIPLNSKGKELIPALGLSTWIFYLGVQASRYNDWSNIFLTKNYLKHYIGMVKSWLDYNNIEI